MKRNQFETIDAYIRTFPADVQRTLQSIRRTIQKTAPEAVEAISYGIPAFYLDGRYLVYFAGYKKHVGVYPIPRGNAALQKQLSPYLSGKATARPWLVSSWSKRRSSRPPWASSA